MILFRIMQLSFEFCVLNATYIQKKTNKRTCFHIAQPTHTHTRKDMRESSRKEERKLSYTIYILLTNVIPKW